MLLHIVPGRLFKSCYTHTRFYPVGQEDKQTIINSRGFARSYRLVVRSFCLHRWQKAVMAQSQLAVMS